MEVIVRDISFRYVSEQQALELFSTVGTVVKARSDLKERSLCILYLNLADSLRARCLDGLELGDARLRVELNLRTEAYVFGKSSAASLETRQDSRTLVCSGLPPERLEAIVQAEERVVKLASEGLVFAEFQSRQAMLQALLKIRTHVASSEGALDGRIHAEEACRCLRSLRQEPHPGPDAQAQKREARPRSRERESRRDRQHEPRSRYDERDRHRDYRHERDVGYRSYDRRRSRSRSPSGYGRRR